MRNSRADPVFLGKRRLFKILNDEKYIFNTVNSGQNLVSRTSTTCSKILKDKKYFNTVKNSMADSVFQGKRRLFKILNDEKCIFNTVKSGHSDFRASTTCSKNLNVKSIFNTVKNFRATMFSEQAQVTQKSLFQCSEHFQG